MDLAPEDFPRLLDRIDEIRSREKYTKIFGITPVTLFEEFKARGYRIEARVSRLLYRKNRRSLYCPVSLCRQRDCPGEQD